MKTEPRRHGETYRRIRRILDGAMRDAFAAHPDWVGEDPDRLRASIAKRATTVLIFELHQGRLIPSQAALVVGPRVRRDG